MYRYRPRRGNSLNPLAALLIVIGVVAIYLAFERLNQRLPAGLPTPTVIPPTAAAALPTAQPSPLPSRQLPFRVAAPSVNLLAEIVPLYFDMRIDTWNLDYLYNQAGHLEGTANLDEGGNFVLAGHVELGDGQPGPFARIGELRKGDLISIFRDNSAAAEVILYAVTDVLIVAPNDFSVIRNRGYEELTLITCTDWDAQKYDYLKRVVVRARRL